MKRHLVAPLILVLSLAGCYSWRPITVCPRQMIEDEQPGLIRIVHADGTRLVLRNPSVDTDSVTARIKVIAGGRAYTRTVDWDTVRIALTDVVSAEAQRLSTGKILGLAAVPIALYLAVVLSLPEDFGR